MGTGGLLDSIRGFDGLALVAAVLGLGLLVAFHELGHHLLATWTGMRVRRFSVGMGPAILSRTYKGVDYTLGAIPFGGFVDVVGLNPLEEGAASDPASYQRAPRWARGLMLAAGPVFNFALAWIMFVGLFWLGGLKQDVEFVVQRVIAGSAAEAVGLQEGDVVLSVEGHKLGRQSSLPSLVGEATGRELEINVRRNGEMLTFKPIPRGPAGAGKLGIAFDQVPVGEAGDYTLPEALTLSTAAVANGMVRIMEDVARMLRPGEEVEVGGPVEMVRQLKKSASKGAKDLLIMLAMLSVMLGLFNLFPIPPLDGSKLLMLGVEAVARRDIPGKVHAVVQGVGMLAMLAVLFVVTVGDVFGPEKGLPKAAPKAPAAQPAPAAEPAPAPAPPQAAPATP